MALTLDNDYNDNDGAYTWNGDFAALLLCSNFYCKCGCTSMRAVIPIHIAIIMRCLLNCFLYKCAVLLQHCLQSTTALMRFSEWMELCTSLCFIFSLFFLYFFLLLFLLLFLSLFFVLLAEQHCTDAFLSEWMELCTFLFFYFFIFFLLFSFLYSLYCLQSSSTLMRFSLSGWSCALLYS